MFSLKEYREPTQRLADRLPWAALVAPDVVVQKDGLLQKTITFRGPDLGSSSPQELLYSHDQLNNALTRLGSGWAVFFEADRLLAKPYPQTRWQHPAAWVADVERSRSFAGSAHYESEYYITFVWQPPSAVPPDAWRRATSFFFADAGGAQPAGDPTRENDQLRREIRAFTERVDTIVRLLKVIFVEVNELDGEGTLTYLHAATSTERHRVRVPDVAMYIDTLLGDSTFEPGEIPRLGKLFMPTCTVVDFPISLQPGVLDALNYLECEYRFVTRWIPLDKADAKAVLESYQLRWLQKRIGLRALASQHFNKQPTRRVDLGADDHAVNVETAMRALSGDVESFGYLTTTVTVWDPVYARAREKMALVKQVVQTAGFTVQDESTNSRQAWLGSLPGNVYPSVRRPLVSTRNLVRLLPTNAPWTGQARNRQLEKVCGVSLPHILCRTSGATPFRLNLNVSDVGHTLIVGRTGGGKSTLLNVLALQWLKYPRARVLLFDKDRSARASTLAIGGTMLEPGNPLAPGSLQPLGDLEVRSNRQMASLFVLALFVAQGVAETSILKEHVEGALENLAHYARQQRTLSTLASVLSSYDSSYAQILQPYYGTGHFAQIFDANEDQISTTQWTMVEMGHLMGLGPAVIVPALLYLFHRVEQQFTGDPTLLILDEAWLFLGHPVFALRIKEWLKTLRKKNVFVVFATQEATDVTKNPLLEATILQACHTRIFLADPEASAFAEHYGKLGLTPTEVQVLGTMSQKRDYYYRSILGRRVFSLDLGPVQLALAGMSGADEQKALDRIVETRPPTEYLEALLEHAKVDWAIDALRRQRAANAGVPTRPGGSHAAARV
jgi:type IV secretion system protein TrbE